MPAADGMISHPAEDAPQGPPAGRPLDSVEKVLTAGVALGLEMPYGEGMELSSWAENHTEDLLRPLGRRWHHAQGVADVARDLAGGLTPEDADVLVAASYLHDIGYAHELATTGFHPLDGARHLQALGYERLAGCPQLLQFDPRRDETPA